MISKNKKRIIILTYITFVSCLLSVDDLKAATDFPDAPIEATIAYTTNKPSGPVVKHAEVSYSGRFVQTRAIDSPAQLKSLDSDNLPGNYFIGYLREQTLGQDDWTAHLKIIDAGSSTISAFELPVQYLNSSGQQDWFPITFQMFTDLEGSGSDIYILTSALRRSTQMYEVDVFISHDGGFAFEHNTVSFPVSQYGFFSNMEADFDLGSQQLFLMIEAWDTSQNAPGFHEHRVDMNTWTVTNSTTVISNNFCLGQHDGLNFIVNGGDAFLSHPVTNPVGVPFHCQQTNFLPRQGTLLWSGFQASLFRGSPLVSSDAWALRGLPGQLPVIMGYIDQPFSSTTSEKQGHHVNFALSVDGGASFRIFVQVTNDPTKGYSEVSTPTNDPLVTFAFAYVEDQFALKSRHSELGSFVEISVDVEDSVIENVDLEFVN